MRRVFGMVMYGAPAFAKRNTEILATFYKGTTKQQAIRRIRFVTPDVKSRAHVALTNLGETVTT